MRHNKWYRVPFVNILYDAFMEEVPTSQQLYDMLLTIGLISALLLTVVMALPMSFEYEELEEARRRFNSAPYDSVYDDNFDTILSQHVGFTSSATYLLGASVSVTVLLLATSAAGIENSGSNRMRKRWWLHARFVVFFIIVSAILGTVFSFYAFNRTVYLKFPDLWVEEKKRGMLFPSLTSSTFGMYRSWASLYLAFFFILSMVLLSYAKATAAAVIEKDDDDFIEEEEEEEEE